MRILVTIFLLAIAGAAGATNLCSTWTVKDPGSYCLLDGGAEGLYYTRECSDESRICRWRHTSDCEKTVLCTQDNPNALIDCGPWRRLNGVTCMDRVTGTWGDKWARSCVLGGMVEEHCSNRPPPGAIN